MEINSTPAVTIDRLLFCLAGLGEMSIEMTQNPNPKTTMRTILRMALGTFAISKGAIFQFRQETRQLTLLTARGIEERSMTLSLPDVTARYFHSSDDPILGEMIQQAPAMIRFVDSNEQAMRDLPKSLWVPLFVRRQFFGLLMLSDKFDRTPYDQTEIELLMMIGRQIAVTLHNHHLHFQLSLKVLELEQLHDISLAINSSLNRGFIIKELVSKAVTLINARRGIFMTVDENRKELEIAAACNYTYWPIGKKIPIEDSWVSRVVLKAKGEIIDNPMEIPPELDSFNCLAVPITSREKVIGVLSIYDKEEGLGIGEFTEGDTQLLAALAGQAAASIENARLYELATVDGLTQLYIRRHFEMRYAEEIRRSKRYGNRLSFMMIDIDHFKRFN
ncbi:MAG TPA: GAF domain-containing protein, partial [Chroococcales cyanobacterium]